MSTLEVTCTRCEKKFRVRAEFAGKSTRCPGCSAPITIGSAVRPAAPATPEVEERPRSRSRRRDDEDDEPRRPAANWAAVDMAFRREQVAVIFVFVGILCDYLAYCLTASMGAGAARMEGVSIALVLLFVVGPCLVAAAFGLMARISAMKPPPESGARTSAIASLLCALAGLGCLVVLAFNILMSIDSQRPMELAMVVGMGGLVLAMLASVATFLAFIAQVGIARRSAAVSRGAGSMAVGIAVCTLSLIGIAVLYALMSELMIPTYSRGPQYQTHDVFYRVALLLLAPIALGAILILYHRLLAAGRRAVQGEPPERYEG